MSALRAAAAFDDAIGAALARRRPTNRARLCRSRRAVRRGNRASELGVAVGMQPRTIASNSGFRYLLSLCDVVLMPLPTPT